MKNFKKFLIALIPVLAMQIAPDLVSAQAKIVTGRILDNNDQPIIGASVLLSSDGRFLEGTSTSLEGKFYIQYEPGENEYCMLNISAFGFCAIISDVEVFNDTTYIEFNLVKKPLDLVGLDLIQQGHYRDTKNPAFNDSGIYLFSNKILLIGQRSGHSVNS